TLVFQNDRFSDFVADEHLNLKVTTESTEDGGARYFALIKGKDNQYTPKELFFVAQKDMFNTSPLFMNKAGDTLYMLDSRDRNTSALMGFNLETGKNTLIAEDKRVDISDVLVHPTDRTIQATAATYTKPEWTLLDK